MQRQAAIHVGQRLIISLVVHGDNAQVDQAGRLAGTFADLVQDFVGIQQMRVTLAEFAQADQRRADVEQCQPFVAAIPDLAQQRDLVIVGVERGG